MINIDLTNIEETSLNIKGFDVKVLRKDDKYAVVITNNTGYDFFNVPSDYNYIGVGDKFINLIHQRCNDNKRWWCNLLWEARGNGNGNIDNGKYELTPSQINIILQAIENGVNEMEKLCQPEIIKIREVTITKKHCDKQHVYLSVDNLIHAAHYPDCVGNSYVAYMVGDEYALYDEIHEPVVINDNGYFPNTDFKVTLSDADKIINIIRKSEEILEEYEKPKLTTKGCDFNYLDVHIKLTPDGDDNYRISVEVPSSTKLNSEECIPCVVEELNGHKFTQNIKFRRGDIWNWNIYANGYVGEAFDNDEIFSKEKAEKMYVAIIAYFKAYEKKFCEIKVGDKVKMSGSSQIGIVKCMDGNKSWVKFDDVHITFTTEHLKKVME